MIYPEGAITGFMCKVDWECELGNASGGNTVFPSEADAKKHLKCWEGCGLVEVRVTYIRTVVEGTDQC